MLSFNFYLDTRRRRPDGSSQVMLVIYLPSHRKRMIRTEIFVDEALWDGARRRVSDRHPNWRRLNLALDRMAVEVEEYVLAHLDDDPAESVREIEYVLFPDRREKREAERLERERRDREMRRLVDVARRFAAMKSERSTRDTYERLVRHLERFDADAQLDDVNRTWLSEFDAYMAGYAPSPNARALYMRNLRAVFNFAIDEELTVNYPFRKFKIKTVKTAKRNLSAADLRRLLTMEVEDWQLPYRDFFFLSFFLIGTNPKDLLYLPAGADRPGRVTFNRSKTKKLYSIKVEPEARAIIDQHRGKCHLLDIMDTRKDYLQYVRYCNHALQTIGMNCRKGVKPTGEAAFPELTLYWARHSWATIAAQLDIPKETIAAALGHDMGNRTTAIYIEYNRDKVDEANRKVIDFVLGGSKAASEA